MGNTGIIVIVSIIALIILFRYFQEDDWHDHDF